VNSGFFGEARELRREEESVASMPELAIDTATIVLRGKFDPGILSAKELFAEGLISSSDLSQASQKFSTKDIAIFETETIKVLANRELIQLTSQSSEEFDSLRDLAVNILRLLEGQSLGVMGINRDVHFSVETAGAWHAIGDRLVPKDEWAHTLGSAGLSSLVLQAIREDLYEGFRVITIQTSSLVPQGIYVGHNDHYTLSISDGIPANRDQIVSVAHMAAVPTFENIAVAIKILNGEWNNSMNRALDVIEHVAQEASA
jgi:hypothetical protein